MTPRTRTIGLPSRQASLALAGTVALIAAAVTLGFGVQQSQAGDMPAGSASVSMLTPKAIAFHDAMRGLWQYHGTYTERAIVSFVAGNPDTNAVIGTLLQNQVDIGNAVKPYYGRAAGDKVTTLLKAHILGAVDVLTAAKSGDKNKLAQAEAAWSANGQQIADFLHAANPRFLARAAAREMMKVHLQQVIEQAVDELQGNYAADAQAYAPYIRHILDMADMISGGIIKQFPRRFR